MGATTKQRSFSIGKRRIGPGEPVYVVAELSGNHNRDFDRALQLVHAAKDAGADAVKLQTYTAATLTIACDKELFRVGKGTLWEGKTLYDLYEEAHTPWDWQPKLKQAASALGMDCFSTPFDPTATDFLDAMDVPVHKVASFEIVDLALLRRVGASGKPVIMSTGMATLTEIEEAMKALREGGCPSIALLKCTSGYPADPAEMNLRTIPHMADAFDVVVGLSDHTMDVAVPVAAVALGACIVEKHLTLARADGGPDSGFSLEPHEFRAMTEAVRTTQHALGTVQYEVSPREAASRVFRRSLFVVEPIPAGGMLTEQNVRSIRPGYGLAPRFLDVVMGRRAVKDIEAGTPLTWELLA